MDSVAVFGGSGGLGSAVVQSLVKDYMTNKAYYQLNLVC